MIEKVPAEKRDGLGLFTASGVNISISSVMRYEETYILIRGRLMGSQDANQAFFIPYAQIDCLTYMRQVKEEEVAAWYGSTPKSRPSVNADGEEPAANEAAAEPAPMEAAPAAPGQGLSTALPAAGPLPGKAAILERLRKRTGSSAPGTVKKPTLGSAPGTAPRPALPPGPGAPRPGGLPPRPQGGSPPPNPPEK